MSTPNGVFCYDFFIILIGGDFVSTYKRIRDLREDKDLTQKQLADALFMHLTQYRRYETGEREVTLELAITLSKFYNVSVDYIAGTTDKMKIFSKNSLTSEEISLLNKFRDLSETDRKKIYGIIDVLKNHNISNEPAK